MIVYDPLYGPFEVPSYLVRLVLTPEVRRLSQIRLLNSLSPSVATLSEIRRYSHTLGVLHLCGLLSTLEYSDDERAALAASVLLHDIGTAPFGHLLEYHLKEARGWSHEDVIRLVLRRIHAPENVGHQIFAGRAVEFAQTLRSVRIPLELVEAIVTRKHPLSVLLFGSIDLDNLDNVARMAWGLGLGGGNVWATHLASSLSVTRKFRLCLSADAGRQAVRSWSSVRKSVYDILTFDPPTAAAQAVLSDAIGTALAEGALDENDWPLTDEALLDLLRNCPQTKSAIIDEYLGRVPSMVFAIHMSGLLPDLFLEDRRAAKALVEETLAQEFGPNRGLGYIFVDRATFQKRLQFLDPITKEEWEEGEDSQTLVLYGFLRGHSTPSRKRSDRAADRLLDALHADPRRVLRIQLGGPPDSRDDQSSFDFAAT